MNSVWPEKKYLICVITIMDNLLRRVVLEMVSRAIVRARRMRMVSKPDSAAMRSLMILTSVVSVLWRGQKQVWNISHTLLLVKWQWS